MKSKVVILGGGIAGLTTAVSLMESSECDITVVEKEPEVGGLARTFPIEGMRSDIGPHRFQTRDENILKFFKRFAGDGIIAISDKRLRIRFKRAFLRYPFDIIDLARKIGLLKVSRYTFGTIAGRLSSISGNTSNYEDEVVGNVGRPIYEEIFRPMAEKMWGIDPKALSADVARERLVLTSITDLVRRLVNSRYESAEYQNVFYYPREGIAAFPERMKLEITGRGGKVMTSSKPERIVLEHDCVKVVHITRDQGKVLLECDELISTIPLPGFMNILDPGPGPEVIEAAGKLKFRGLVLLLLAISRSSVSRDHMIYFPEKRYPFHRIYEQKNFSDAGFPDDRTVLCLEFPADEKDERWKMSAEQLTDLSIDGLEEAELVKRSDIISSHTVRISSAYPLYETGYREALGILRDELLKISNLYLLGRSAAFKLNNIDHAIDMGLETARLVSNKLAGKLEYEEHKSDKLKLFDSFRRFRIVD